MKKKRILKSERFLEALLVKDDEFHVGLPLESVLKCENFKRYGSSKDLLDGSTFMPQAKGATSKSNKNGKLIRKEPNEWTVKTTHISYRNKRGKLIEYDRHFNVYVKVLKHKFEIKFSCIKNQHGERMLVSPLLVFEDTDNSNMKNTHVINLFLEIFGEFEIYTASLEPALAFTNKYDFEVLPKGVMENEDIVYLIEGARRFIREEEEVKAYQKRLQVINEFCPQIVGKGSQGFWGYIVFGFKNSGVVLLESMYNQNATYVFDMDIFESLIAKNKQDILTNKLAKYRFMHNKNWESKIKKYLMKVSA